MFLIVGKPTQTPNEYNINTINNGTELVNILKNVS